MQQSHCYESEKRVIVIYGLPNQLFNSDLYTPSFGGLLNMSKK